jgi:perosamine synthetase
VIAALGEQGVETRPGFYPFTVMPLYGQAARLPVAEKIGAQVISVPTYPTLLDEQIEEVCQRLLALRGA